METKPKKRRGPQIGTDKAARLAAQTNEYGAVRANADRLGISIQQLCDIAAVPFGTVKAWKNYFAKTYANDAKLERLTSVRIEQVVKSIK